MYEADGLGIVGVMFLQLNNNVQISISTDNPIFQVHIQRHYPFLSNLFKSLQNIPYNRSQIQILVVTSFEIELDELINSEGFASVEVIKIEVSST